MIAFVVAGDPVPWERDDANGRRRYTAPRTRAQKRLVAAAARIAGAVPLAGPMKLTVTAYRATRRRCDWDNIGKLVSDALNGVCWHDDSQVEDAHVKKRYDHERPRTEVEVEPLAGAEVVAIRPAKPRASRAVQRDLLTLLPPKKRAAILERRLVSSVRRPG